MPTAPPSLATCLTADGVDPDRLLTALRALSPECLGLHAACTQGGVVDAHSVTIGLLGLHIDGPYVDARCTVFFDELVGGCNCHDDPAPTSTCATVALRIDRRDGSATLTLASETDAGAD